MVCNDVEYSFDASALSRLRSTVIGSVVPADKTSHVQLTARGPLGMDLRAEFCVVPNLDIERPTGVLLPAGHAGRVISHVMVRSPDLSWHRIDVPSGADSVTDCVRDIYGVTADIRIAVPCLQWALAAGSGSRTDLGQQPIRVSARDVLDGGVSLVVIRTRRPNVPLTLQVRQDEDTLATLQASTAGGDGRWAFDLRRFSDAIRSSAEPLLSLVLTVNGREVDVGTVRAELDVTGLTVHPRVAGGEATLTVTWCERRPLRHRVIRLWSVTLPWQPPITALVDDAACGEATLSRSETEIPPGCYLAELGVDDGWTVTLRRPAFNDPAVKQFRLGTEIEEKEWIKRRGDSDPYAVLANAYTFGRARRELTLDEVESLTPAAFEALWAARELGRGRASAETVKAITNLIVTTPDALVRGVEKTVLDWGLAHGVPFTIAILDLLPALAQSPAAIQQVHNIGNLWELCPPLAAALDLPHVTDADVLARCEAGLGASLTESLARDIIPSTHGRVSDLQRLTERSENDLDALRRACSLLPTRPLDLDTQAAAHFEWLCADKRGDFSAKAWAATSYALVERTVELRDDLVKRFESVRVPRHLGDIFPAMYFPEVVWVAALHVLTNSPSAAGAVTALREIVPTCPGIVTRSLVLAAVHVHVRS
jgi:hypothetical protein